MRNDDCCAPECGTAECCLYLPFRLGVERRGRLVEKKDFRICNNGPRDCNSLFLPPRKKKSTTTDMRVKALWHRLNEVVCVRLFGRAFYQFFYFFFWLMLVWCAYEPVSDVFEYCRREYGGLLADETNLLS